MLRRQADAVADSYGLPMLVEACGHGVILPVSRCGFGQAALREQIQLNVGAFMHRLFQQGAFQWQTPRDACFMKCGKETTTDNDVNFGFVGFIVSFRPLKPAEYVIVRFRQIAGQTQA